MLRSQGTVALFEGFLNPIWTNSANAVLSCQQVSYHSQAGGACTEQSSLGGRGFEHVLQCSCQAEGEGTPCPDELEQTKAFNTPV